MQWCKRVCSFTLTGDSTMLRALVLGTIVFLVTLYIFVPESAMCLLAWSIAGALSFVGIMFLLDFVDVLKNGQKPNDLRASINFLLALLCILLLFLCFRWEFWPTLIGAIYGYVILYNIRNCAHLEDSVQMEA